jgi:hypothetical protein
VKFGFQGELHINGPFSTGFVWMAQSSPEQGGNGAAVAKENSNVCAYPLI